MFRFFQSLFKRSKKKLKDPHNPSSNQFSKIPHVAFFDVKSYDSHSFLAKMDLLINSFPVDEKYPLYRRTSFPMISASPSPSTSRSLLLFEKDSYFYFSFFAEENKVVKVLVSRYSMLPIAVVVANTTCIVLVDEVSFSPMKDHLVKKEGFDHSFLYYNMPEGFQPEAVPYSRCHLISDVDSLFKINPSNIESPDHSVIFNRILGFFLIPAIVRDWLCVICSCFDQEDQGPCVRLEGRTSLLWQHWDGASMFVYSGGKIPISADFGYINLAEARVSYSVLRRFEVPSNVTPALLPKLAESIFQDSSTSDVPRVSRVSSTNAVPRFPTSTPAVPGGVPTITPAVPGDTTSTPAVPGVSIPTVQRGPSTPTVPKVPFSTVVGAPSSIDLRGAGSTADLYFPGSHAFLTLGSDSNSALNVGFRCFSSRAASHISSPDSRGFCVAFED